MHILILILAWITPALVAELLGWRGTWGGGGAFVDLIIPIPVAGGTMHVPSFVVLALVVLAQRHNDAVRSYLPVVAFAIAAAALAAMLDYDRLNSWLFTDYTPHGSPFRLDSNPLFLFIVTDALWAGLYLNMLGRRVPAAAWLALPLAPLLVIAGNAMNYKTGGPVFKIGPGIPGMSRGEESSMIYTSAPYDERVYLGWLENSSLLPPWENANTEHEAILFTNSLQVQKEFWKFDAAQDHASVVATICLYEEDRSIEPYSGYQDCFGGRETAEETIERLVREHSTGLGKKIDSWYAYVRMCDEVTLPDSPATDLAREGICLGVRNVYPKRLAGFIDQYGEDSPQVRFVREEAAARGLAAP